MLDSGPHSASEGHPKRTLNREAILSAMEEEPDAPKPSRFARRAKANLSIPPSELEERKERNEEQKQRRAERKPRRSSAKE